MFEAWVYSLASVLAVSVVSLVGILFFSASQKTLKSLLPYAVSFSAGALFGDAFIHLLPEAVEKNGFGLMVSIYLLCGIILSFIVEKVIHWRHCHFPHTHKHSFALMNLYGDVIHNFIDGLIIAASYLASIPVGIATTLAVVFHEIPQEIGDFGVLVQGGFSKKKALLFNFAVSLTAIIGAVFALLLNNAVPATNAFLIPFAAGGFIYIAGSDLIPELHKEVEVKKSILQLATFVLGILVMVALLSLG